MVPATIVSHQLFTTKRVIRAAATPTAKGYRLEGVDGGIFTFGDAA